MKVTSISRNRRYLFEMPVDNVRIRNPFRCDSTRLSILRTLVSLQRTRCLNTLHILATHRSCLQHVGDKNIWIAGGGSSLAFLKFSVGIKAIFTGPIPPISIAGSPQRLHNPRLIFGGNLYFLNSTFSSDAGCKFLAFNIVTSANGLLLNC